MPLQRDRAVTEDASRTFSSTVPFASLGPVDHFLAVKLDHDIVVFDRDILGEPLVVFDNPFDYFFSDVFHVIQASALDGIGVGVVHLDFESLARESGLLILGMEIDAAIDRKSVV